MTTIYMECRAWGIGGQPTTYPVFTAICQIDGSHGSLGSHACKRLIDGDFSRLPMVVSVHHDYHKRGSQAGRRGLPAPML